MKKYLLAGLMTILSIGVTLASKSVKTGCLLDNQGNQYSLTLTNTGNSIVWDVTGFSYLSVDPGVAWNTTGVYDTITKKLVLHIINPSPNDCATYVDSVVINFRYIGNIGNVRNGRGTFYNYCSGGICCSGPLTVSGTPGLCSSTMPRSEGEFSSNTAITGGVGSPGQGPANSITLPEGTDLNAILRDNTQVNVLPNPAYEKEQISVTLDQASSVDIRVYDILGRLVRNLISTNLNSGSNLFTWDLNAENGAAVPDGLYLIVVKIGDNTTTKRIAVNH